MKFGWKDAVGLSSLIAGLGLATYTANTGKETSGSPAVEANPQGPTPILNTMLLNAGVKKSGFKFDPFDDSANVPAPLTGTVGGAVVLPANDRALDDRKKRTAALIRLSTQPMSRVTLDSILEELQSYQDPFLIPHALAELQKYEKSEYRTDVYKAISTVLRNGSDKVREELIKNINPFLNDDSVPHFREALKSMDPKSTLHSLLRTTLQEYDQHKTGA